MPIINVPIKGGQTIEWNTDILSDENFPIEAYMECCLQVAKHFLNAGMGDIKLTGLKGQELERAQAVIMEKAQANLSKLNAGEIRITGGKSKAKSKGVEKAVMTEATRLVKGLVKDAIKAKGVKVSTIPARQITELAKAYLNSDEGEQIIEQARANIEASQAKTEALSAGMAALVGGVRADPKLLAKQQEKNVSRKKPGVEVTQRTKPAPQHTAH